MPSDRVKQSVLSIAGLEDGLEAAEFLLTHGLCLLQGRSTPISAKTLENGIELWLAQRAMLKDKGLRFCLGVDPAHKHVYNSDVYFEVHKSQFASTKFVLACACGQTRYF